MARETADCLLLSSVLFGGPFYPSFGIKKVYHHHSDAFTGVIGLRHSWCSSVCWTLREEICSLKRLPAPVKLACPSFSTSSPVSYGVCVLATPGLNFRDCCPQSDVLSQAQALPGCNLHHRWGNRMWEIEAGPKFPSAPWLIKRAGSVLDSDRRSAPHSHILLFIFSLQPDFCMRSSCALPCDSRLPRFLCC